MWTLPLLIVLTSVVLSVPCGSYLAWIVDGRYDAPRWLRWINPIRHSRRSRAAMPVCYVAAYRRSSGPEHLRHREVLPGSSHAAVRTNPAHFVIVNMHPGRGSCRDDGGVSVPMPCRAGLVANGDSAQPAPVAFALGYKPRSSRCRA